MSNKIRSKKSDQELQIEEVLSKSEMFFQNYGKKIIITIAVLIISVGGFFAYNSFVKLPAGEKAVNSIFVAQQYFAAGDMETALNGDENNLGFAQIATEFSGTSVANIANHYAGICYLNLGDYKSAIAALKDYSHVDGTASIVINAQNFGLIGDAYAQLKDSKNAISFYAKAYSFDNSLTAPYYLKKAGLLKLAGADKAGAKECFDKVKTNYFGSLEGRDIEKYIGQCL